MLNILRTFQLGFHRFFSLYLCSAWNRRDRNASTAPNYTKRPQHERKLQPRHRPCSPPRPMRAKAFHTGCGKRRNRGWRPRCGPGADITTKAQWRHTSGFVHRNKNWNSSFILHYWQRTILTLTLVVCSNASISCHCLSSEMKTAI